MSGVLIFKCTAENPWNKDVKADKFMHPDAKEIEEDYGRGGGVADGDYVKMKCSHCGKEWWEELPN